MYPMINMKATGIRLRQIMDRKNITVKDVQQYLNLSCVQSVYRWLGGHSMPTVVRAYALAIQHNFWDVWKKMGVKEHL